MGIFGKLESLVGEWRGKKDVQKRLQALSEAIAACGRTASLGDNVYSKNAKEHVGSAERNYKEAIGKFKAEDFEGCIRLVDRGMLHIRCAQTNLNFDETLHLELDFPDDSAESLLERLAEAIVITKLAIEYTNCTVSPSIAERVILVVSLFKAAMDKLADDNEVRAKRIADGALLLLYALTKQIDAENQANIVEIRLAPRESYELDREIQALADQLASCKSTFIDSGLVVPPSIQLHFADAEMSLFTSIDSLIDNDPGAVKTAVSSGMMQLEHARRLLQSTDPGRIHENNSAKAATDENALVEQIQIAAGAMKMKEHDKFEKHLRASVQFFEKAKEAMHSGDHDEAERLAKAAWLDLDFAQQLAFSKQRAKYRDI